MGDTHATDALSGSGIQEDGAGAPLRRDRGTIHNWIASGQLDRDEAAGEARYKRRRPVTRKRDLYKGIVESRLEAHPKLSAQGLFDEIRKSG